MTEIRWKYIGTFIVGVLFLFVFSGAISGVSGLNAGADDFLYFYRDKEAAEALVQGSDDYGISCKIWNFVEADRDNSGQETAITVQESDFVKYQNIADYFSENDGKIEAGLMKWLQRCGIILFIAGILALYLRDCRLGFWVKTGRFSIAVLVWGAFIKTIPAAVRFPKWLLPGRWSDFEGWTRLKGDIGNQFLAMITYRDIPAAGAYYSGVCGTLLLLIAAFLLLLLYRWCCMKAEIPFIVHILLTIVGAGMYIRLGNPELKAVINFFPCYAITQYLTS